MPVENNDGRLKKMLERRAHFIPLIPESPVDPRVAKLQTFGEVNRDIHLLLASYEPSFHAAFEDKITHPEELLLRDGSAHIQFALPTTNPAVLTYVRMDRGNLGRGEAGVPNKSASGEYGCRKTVFCTTSAYQIDLYRKTFLDANFKELVFDKPNGEYESRDLIGINFDNRGKIRDIMYQSKGLVYEDGEEIQSYYEFGYESWKHFTNAVYYHPGKFMVAHFNIDDSGFRFSSRTPVHSDTRSGRFLNRKKRYMHIDFEEDSKVYNVEEIKQSTHYSHAEDEMRKHGDKIAHIMSMIPFVEYSLDK